MKQFLPLVFALLFTVTGAHAYNEPSSASAIATQIKNQSGCSTAGYVWVPASNTCVAPASGSGAPGGSNGQVQYNNGGLLGGLTLGNTLISNNGQLSTQDITNPQTGTSYTVLANDMGKTVTHTNASSVAVTLPQANSTGFATGSSFTDCNYGAGVVTITASGTSTINGSPTTTTTLALGKNECAYLIADTANWNSFVSAAAASGVSSLGNSDGTLTISGSTGAITASCRTGTVSQLGCLKPDGTSITVTGGVISAAGGGAGSGTVNTGTANYLTYYATSSSAVSATPTLQLAANGLNITTKNAISFPSSDSTQGNSIAIGPTALSGQTTSAAYANIAIGSGALAGTMAVQAINNVAIGYNAGTALTSGHDNLFFGAGSGSQLTTGIQNLAIGSNAAVGNGQDDVTIGRAAGALNEGSSNIIIGNSSGRSLNTGASNVLIGNAVAGTTLSTGSGNILIGTSSAVDAVAGSSTNTLNIGNVLYGTGIGTAATPGNIGIGTASPTTALTVNGVETIGPAGAPTPFAFTTAGYTVPAKVQLVRFNQSSTVASGTVTLPTVTADTYPIEFNNYTGAITAFTFSPAVQGFTNTSSFAANTTIKVRWDATASIWVRVQ